MKTEKNSNSIVSETKLNTEAIELTRDTIKKIVEVTPLNYGGANFKTNKLVIENKNRISFKPTLGVILFCMLLILIGSSLLFYFANQNMDSSISKNKWVLLLVGAAFTITGCAFLYLTSTPRVFDKTLGLYFKGFKPKDIITKTNASNKQTELSAIIALQIIEEHITSSENSYPSFELNLVLKNGSRINVVDHGNLKSLIKDTQTISDFLGVPIWHATSNSEL